MLTSIRLAIAGALAWASLATLAGCTAQHDIEPRLGLAQGVLPAELENRAEAVRQDPVAYLHQVADRCRALRQYTLKFTRHERRGLLRILYGPEHIQCWFRREPFSVRMKWLDEDIKYGESAYVEGQADNKVRFVTRWWSPPLLPPPQINTVDLQTPVVWGESKRPLTDFGLERMMERTLASLERAGDHVIVRYEPPLVLPESGRAVHHLHLEYPPTQHRVPIQELYIDVLTDLPAGTVLKFPAGTIDAAYFYMDIDPAVTLTDDDFRLEVERAARPDSEKSESKAP